MSMTTSYDVPAIELWHLQLPGNKTACGKQISGGLLRLNTLPLEMFDFTGHIVCEACRRYRNDILGHYGSR